MIVIHRNIGSYVGNSAASENGKLAKKRFTRLDVATRNIIDSRSDYAHVEHVANAGRRLMKFYGNGYWPSRLTRIVNTEPKLRASESMTDVRQSNFPLGLIKFLREGKSWFHPTQLRFTRWQRETVNIARSLFNVRSFPVSLITSVSVSRNDTVISPVFLLNGVL